MKKLLISLLALTFFAPGAFAAKFANQFVEFELPPQWQCALEGAEWVCQNTKEEKKRDAIIVLAAKLKGDQDSLDQYFDYLKAPKTWNSIQNKPMKSDPKWVKYNDINGQKWVDSLHMESEIPNFFTRYLATIKQDIGVLVTYSINKTKYQEYTSDFENMVKTLKVFRKAGGINTNGQGNAFTNTVIPQGVSDNSVFPGTNPAGGAPDSNRPKGGDNTPLWPLLIVAAGIGYYIWRKRQSR